MRATEKQAIERYDKAKKLKIRILSSQTDLFPMKSVMFCTIWLKTKLNSLKRIKK